jgi:hypothetical protein
MIKNGLYALNASSRDGVAEDVGGVLILRDGQLHGGDAYVYYTGSYECSAGNWQGKMTSQEHTPTTRPMAAKLQHIGFFGTYNDAGAKVDAMALLGEQSFRERPVFGAQAAAGISGIRWLELDLLGDV